MTTPSRLPRYPHRPIQRLNSLSIALQTPLLELQRLATIANTLYRAAAPIPKSDGTFRQTFDALPRLKAVQRKIQARFLVPVQFPDYLTGSVKGRDSVRNAALHAGAAMTVSEDVASFFPNTTSSVIISIWSKFFRFSPEVSHLLTALTTKDGCLPQGAVTSSYLANLAFWNREPTLQQQLNSRGIVYSRYVDDITISSRRQLTNAELSQCIAQVYGMMFGSGMKPKRVKQEISRGNGPLVATKLTVNRRAALSPKERSAIRTAVHQLELKVATGERSTNVRRQLNSVAGRIGHLGRLHPTEGRKLKARVAHIRQEIANTSPKDLL